jgi:ergot alkaloid biosynthesis protein
VKPDILITGGTGKTGRKIARQLAEQGLAARAASRSGNNESGQPGVRFDWADDATYDAALSGIGAVYLVAPQNTFEPLSEMQPFLEKALRQGVKRYVLLSSSALDENGPMMGKVHAWLKSEVPEWTVLRPSWFMQNLIEPVQLSAIRDEGAIYSATGTGRIGFIDAEDIAAVAVSALTGPIALNDDFILTGPEAISYGDVAKIIAEHMNKPVEHYGLTRAELIERWIGLSFPLAYAEMLTDMDIAIAAGSEDRVTDNVSRITGHSAHNFQTFVDAQSVFNASQA